MYMSYAPAPDGNMSVEATTMPGVGEPPSGWKVTACQCWGSLESCAAADSSSDTACTSIWLVNDDSLISRKGACPRWRMMYTIWLAEVSRTTPFTEARRLDRPP